MNLAEKNKKNGKNQYKKFATKYNDSLVTSNSIKSKEAIKSGIGTGTVGSGKRHENSENLILNQFTDDANNYSLIDQQLNQPSMRNSLIYEITKVPTANLKDDMIQNSI